MHEVLYSEFLSLMRQFLKVIHIEFPDQLNIVLKANRFTMEIYICYFKI